MIQGVKMEKKDNTREDIINILQKWNDSEDVVFSTALKSEVNEDPVTV